MFLRLLGLLSGRVLSPLSLKSSGIPCSLLTGNQREACTLINIYKYMAFIKNFNSEKNVCNALKLIYLFFPHGFQVQVPSCVNWHPSKSKGMHLQNVRAPSVQTRLNLHMHYKLNHIINKTVMRCLKHITLRVRNEWRRRMRNFGPSPLLGPQGTMYQTGQNCYS